MIGLLFLMVAATGPLDVEGVWQTANGKAHVEVTVTDAGPRGVIVWYEDHEEHQARLAAMGAKEREENRVLGMVLLEGFEEGEEGQRWRKGTIFDPTSGKSYRSSIYRAGDILEVEGCLGIFCRTQEWALIPPGEVVRLEPVTGDSDR